MQIKIKDLKRLLNEKILKKNLLQIEVKNDILFFRFNNTQVAINNEDNNIKNSLTYYSALDIKKFVSKIKTENLEINIDNTSNLILDFKKFKCCAKLSGDETSFNCFDKSEKFIEFDTKNLQETIKKTIFYVSKNELREPLTHIVIFYDKDYAIKYAAATDGIKLITTNYKDDAKIKIMYEQNNYILLNKDMCNFIMLIDTLNQTHIYINNESEKILIKDENSLIYSRYLKLYPDFLNAIPKYEDFFIVNTKKLKEKLKQILPFTDNKNNYIKLEFCKSLLKINFVLEDNTINTINAIFSECDYTIDLTIAINCKILLDMLKNYEDATIKFYYKNAIGSLIFYDKNDLKLLMLLKIKTEN